MPTPSGLCTDTADALIVYCPFCQAQDTRVVDSRLTAEGGQVRRRRECGSCGNRFTTFEEPQLKMPNVVKADGRRQPFTEAKLRGGMQRALEKRPVATEAMEAAIRRVLQKLRTLDASEVPSREIGELVSRELKDLDQVAYVRFASVYRSFEDVEAFEEEIRRLRQEAADARQLSLLDRGG